jgi:hypothetical protein
MSGLFSQCSVYSPCPITLIKPEVFMEVNSNITEEEKKKLGEVVKGICGPLGVFKAWEPVIGHERALDALRQWITGTAYLNMKGAQLQLGMERVETIDDFLAILGVADGQFGCRYVEVEKKAGGGKVLKCVLCPFAEASKKTGWDGREVCEKIFGPLAPQISQDFSPNIQWNLLEWNSDPIEGCLYEIINKGLKE